MSVHPLAHPSIRVRVGVLLLAISATAMTGCSGSRSLDAAPPPTTEIRCDAVTPEFSRTFVRLNDGRRATPICVADVGPGLDSPDLAAEFSSVVAGHVTNPERMSSTNLDLLGVMVGTLKSGRGEDFVARLMSRLGPDAAHGTTRVADRTLQFIDLRPGGPRGWAYGKGDKVFVAYARSPLGPPSHPLMAFELEAAVGDLLPFNTPVRTRRRDPRPITSTTGPWRAATSAVRETPAGSTSESEAETPSAE